VLLVRVAEAAREGRMAWWSLAGLGTLAGLGLNLDLGGGPLLVAATFGLVVWRTRRLAAVAVFALTAFPWVAAAIGINSAIGGGWKPVNMYPEYFQYPGSPFNQENLTGFSRHGALDQVLYAGAMLIGKRGFWNHNLPLLLAAAAGWSILRRPFHGRAEMLGMLAWCTATWLLFALLSNNMGGGCCSVRWFAPFLAPGFWLLAILLRDRPELRADFVALSIWGAVLGATMWWTGPWTLRMVPLMWPVVGCGLLTWGWVAWSRRGRPMEMKQPAAPEEWAPRVDRRAA
jgi:hypothetical protein